MAFPRIKAGREILVSVVSSLLLMAIEAKFGLEGASPLTARHGTPPAARAAAQAYLDQALAASLDEDFDRVIAAATAALALDPNLAEAYLSRAWAYGQRGRLEQMIRDCTEVIRLEPGCALAYLNRGWAYGQKGWHAQAVRDYAEAARLDPAMAPARDHVAGTDLRHPETPGWRR